MTPKDKIPDKSAPAGFNGSKTGSTGSTDKSAQAGSGTMKEGAAPPARRRMAARVPGRTAAAARSRRRLRHDEGRRHKLEQPWGYIKKSGAAWKFYDSIFDRSPGINPTLAMAALSPSRRQLGAPAFQPARRRPGSMPGRRHPGCDEGAFAARGSGVHLGRSADAGAAGRAPGASSPRRAKPAGKPAVPVGAGSPSKATL